MAASTAEPSHREKRAKHDDAEFSKKFSSSLKDMFLRLQKTSHSFQNYDVKSTQNFPEDNAELAKAKLEGEHVETIHRML